MAENILFDNNSNIIRFTLKSSVTGQGLTGLSSASSGLIISTICDNEATATAYTVAGSTIETIATLGTYASPTATKCRFKEVDATNHKGLYEFQFADARFSIASSRKLVISATGATNLLDADYEIALVQFNPYDAVRLGLTSLPNAAADAAGGLPISDAGGLDMDSIKTDTAAILVDTGTTLDTKINTIDGIVDDILLDTAEIGTAGAGLTNINLPNQTMDITGNITGNLSGSVGSVTGDTAQTGDLYGLLTSADTELSAVPSTTGTIINKIKFLFQYFRNKRTATLSTESLFKEDATTALGTATLSTDGTTRTKGEMN